MEKKDYFEKQSRAYAAFRPSYPDELYHFIFKYLKKQECAWDCATGNGQVAKYLAHHFQSVYATDISAQQLRNAFAAPNIVYSLSAAEHTDFRDHQFDLITVAQALHWLDRDQFYKEARRTGKPGALLAVWGYSLLNINPEIDDLFLDFYYNKVGLYWDSARRIVENHYRDVHFPFEAIESPRFYIRVNWTRDQFAGYLTSWSATQRYILHHGKDPVEDFRILLNQVWKDGDTKPVTFPAFMKLGRIAS